MSWHPSLDGYRLPRKLKKRAQYWNGRRYDEFIRDLAMLIYTPPMADLVSQSNTLLEMFATEPKP